MEVVALRSAYGWIGFSGEAALVITDAQGNDSMEDVDILIDREI